MTEASEGKKSLWRRLIGPAVLLGLVLVLFRTPLLLSGRDGVIGAAEGDIQQQFVPWREFMAEQLSRGQVPLWNPYSFGGQPFVGNFQSAVFYPPNWLHLVLPVGLAITLIFAAHVYLAGLFTLGWLRFKGYSSLAAMVGAAGFMLSAPVLGRAFPGHLTWVCVVAWTPVVFWCIDGLLAGRRGVTDEGEPGDIEHPKLPALSFGRSALTYAWLGAGAIAMQILAGYPQPLYITLVAATVYCVLCSVQSPQRWRAVGGLMAMIALGVAIAAVQLFPGLAAARDSVRAGGTTFDFASTYALPVANLVLALSPNALGGMSTATYTGQWLPWEVTPYMGAVVALLAVVGALMDHTPRRRFAVTVLAFCAVLALGPATPLFRWAFEGMPGFALFRVPGRWLLPVALFIAPLAASGVEVLRARRGGVVGAVLGGVVAAVLLVVVLSLTDRSRVSASLVLGVAGALAVLSARVRWAVPALCVLAALELASTSSAWVAVSKAHPAPPSRWVVPAMRDTDDRVAILGNRFLNLPMSARVPGLLGYDPFQPRRWAQFMAATQGIDPRTVQEIEGAAAPHPAWRILRAGVVFGPGDAVAGLPRPLPRVLLVPRAEVLPELSKRLARLMNPAFDPETTVLLEAPPKWPANAGRGDADPTDAEATAPLGTASALPSGDADRLDIEVSAGRKCFLVVTDAYSPGWVARRLDTGELLEIMPADHVIRAIAIDAGKYTVRFEFQPAPWVIGRWVTVVGTVAWAGVGAGLWVRCRRAGQVSRGLAPITRT